MVVMRGSKHPTQKVRFKYSRLITVRDDAVSFPLRFTELSTTPSDILVVELNMKQHTLQVGKGRIY